MLELMVVFLGVGWWLIRARPATAVAVGRYAAFATAGVVLLALASGWPILMSRRPPPIALLAATRYEQLHRAHQITSHVLMIGIGVTFPLLAFAPFGRGNSNRRKNVVFLAASIILALLLMATTFTGYLVPARIPFEEWLDAEVAAGRVAPEGTIFRFLVLHCVVLPATVVTLAVVMARKLRPVQASPSNFSVAPSATTQA